MCGTWISYRWQLRQSRSADAELHIFWSPDRDEMRKWTYLYLEVMAEQVCPGRAEVWKLNFRSLAVKAEQKCGSGTSRFWKSRQRWNAEVDLPIFGSPGRTSAEDERDLSKSWPSVSTESGTSDLWQFRQSGIAEAKLQTFKSPGRAEVQKLNFRSLAAKTGQKFGSGTSHLTKNWKSRRAERISCHIIASQAKWKCGSRISDLWQSCQVGSVEAELYIFDRSLSYWLPLPMLTNNSTDCYNCHSQWRTMWRPGVTKTQDFGNVLDMVIMLPQGLWIIFIWALSLDPLTGLRTRL